MSTVRIKVADTTGPVLNWLAANCLGLTPTIVSVHEQAEQFRSVCHPDGSKPPQETVDAVIASLKPRIYCDARKIVRLPDYSTDWAVGGPIIYREGISWHCANKSSWHAYSYGSADNFNGPTPLIAAMRCFVASQMGETVDVPAELLALDHDKACDDDGDGTSDELSPKG